MISVCMATYNGEKFINKQLRSLYLQTRQADEVIICDDGSKDDTVNIIRSFIDEFGLEQKWRLYVNESNKGYPDNFYYGMSLCSGDLIFLGDQDDLWKADKLERMCSVMEANPDISLLASRWGIIDQDDHVIKEISNGKVMDDDSLVNINVNDIFYFYDWPGMCMCYRKELGKQVLEARGESKLAHDVALALMAAESGHFACVNQINQYHRRHSNNLAKEEHRAGKLLNKTRKVDEIERYLKMLADVEASKCLQDDEYWELVKRKKRIMQERLENLGNGKRFAIIKQYLKNRGEIRVATVVCDLVICGQR